jgi:hypothetical protein
MHDALKFLSKARVAHGSIGDRSNGSQIRELRRLLPARQRFRSRVFAPRVFASAKDDAMLVGEFLFTICTETTPQ